MNPYEVLGLPLTATREEIAAAYRALAKKCHPDVNMAADADARMKRINAAYELILKGWRPLPLAGEQTMWGVSFTVKVYTTTANSSSGYWG